MDLSDQLLLERYAAHRDEAAFRLLVGRYLDMVHAVARRVTANEEMARDVAQTIFIRLAAQAACIPHSVALPAWLHRGARSLAVNSVRDEARRKARERLAVPLMDSSSSAEPDWSALSPVVDELVERLPAADRELLLLRYYCGESHIAIAARLGLTEAVARKRGSRAVEKLRALLGKRGIATSAAALATLLPAHAAPSAPVALSASILQAAQGIVPVAPSFLKSVLLTVNTSQKIAFTGALLLLLAATGYTWSADPAASSAALAPPAAGSPGKPATGKSETSRGRTPRAVPATPEERLERLRAIVRIGNRSEREMQLISFLDALPPGLFEETTRHLQSLDSDRMAFILTASAWAKADAATAIAYVGGPSGMGPGSDMELQILSDWCGQDARAALTWAATRSGAPEEAVKAVLLSVLPVSPEEIGGLIREMPEGKARGAAFEGIATEMDRDPGLMRRILAGASDSQRAVIYGNFAGSLEDPAKGAAVLKEHPEAAPFAPAGKIYREWADKDLPAAVASLAEWPPGKFQREGAEALIRQASSLDLAKTLELMKRFPDAVPDALRQTVVERLGRTDPALALSQTPQISDEERRDAVVVSQLKFWLRSDPAAAAAWLAEHPQPPAVLAKLPPTEN